MDSNALVRWSGLSLVGVAGLAAYFVASSSRPGAEATAETPRRVDAVPATSAVVALPAALVSPPPSEATVTAHAANTNRSTAAPRDAPAPLGTEAAPAAAAETHGDVSALAEGKEEGEPPPSAPPRSAVSPPPSMAVDLPIVSEPLVDAVEPVGAVPVTPAPAARREPERPGPCGGVLVRVITASSDPEWAFATIADGPGKPARIRRVGDPVGPWRVDSIEWDRVWLRGGGGRCPAGINGGAREGRLAAGLDPDDDSLLPAADDAAPPWQVPADVASGIRRRSATEFVIDEQAVAKIFDQAPELLAGVRFEPVKGDSHAPGVAVDSIPPSSLLDRLGVEKGDVVLALNDSPVVTLDAAIVALGDARTRSALVARLQRGGQDFAIDVDVGRTYR